MGFETVNIKNRKIGQAIRIPKEMEIKDDKIYLKKVLNKLLDGFEGKLTSMK